MDRIVEGGILYSPPESFPDRFGPASEALYPCRGFGERIAYVSVSSNLKSSKWATLAVIGAPEPSPLDGFVRGTGLLGLAEMARRKLQLAT